MQMQEGRLSNSLQCNRNTPRSQTLQPRKLTDSLHRGSGLFRDNPTNALQEKCVYSPVVSTGKQRRRNGEAERFRSHEWFEVRPVPGSLAKSQGNSGTANGDRGVRHMPHVARI